MTGNNVAAVTNPAAMRQALGQMVNLGIIDSYDYKPDRGWLLLRDHKVTIGTSNGYVLLAFISGIRTGVNRWPSDISRHITGQLDQILDTARQAL